MTPERGPPWLVRRILELTLPPDVRESVCGDLEELYQRRRHTHGVVRARLWFVKEALLFSACFLWERIRERSQRSDERDGTEHRADFRKGSCLRGGPSWLDFKLGLRMLVRYPGLTLVGVLSMSVGVGLGAAYFEVVNDVLRPTLPFEAGDRIVAIENWDVEASGPQRRSLHDFALWRDQLRSVEELGAFALVEQNLILGEDRAEPVRGAEISAAAFLVARVPPMLGRSLTEADEQEGGPSVVVIGHDVWQSRFSADPDVVGRTVRLGRDDHTVVGVMPEGFAFPINQHFWIPLRSNPSNYERGQGPAIQVFGRLAADVTLEEAQAELTAVGNRAAAGFPGTNEHVRPHVLPYIQLFYGGRAREPAIELILAMILVVISVNVGALVFARTAARANEMAVRHALGASRARIVVQLSVEMLVLALLGAALGLVAAGWVASSALGLFWDVIEGGAPFWWDSGLAPATAIYASGLAVLGAIVAGLLPAIRATGPRVQGRLRHAVDSNGAGLRLGGIWTLVIVTQVAFSVTTLPIAIGLGWGWVQSDEEAADLGFPAEEYLSVRLETSSDTSPGDTAASAELLSRFERTYRELGRRLEGDPAVLGVTFAERLPGMVHRTRQIEVNGVAPPGGRDGIVVSAQALYGHEVETAAVDLTFFDVFRTPIVSGRGFIAGDLAPEQRFVIVNEAFVNEILGGRNAVGQQVRYVRGPHEEPGPWHEIIGVAENLGTERNWVSLKARMRPAMYHPLGGDPDAFRVQKMGPAVASGSGTAHNIRMAVHLRGEPGEFATQLRRFAVELDPDLRLYDVLPLTALIDQVSRANQLLNLLFASIFAAVALIALLISSAGTYALMSFAVTRRAREIAVRAALGARPGRIVGAIFSRAFLQIGGGVLVGLVPPALLTFISFDGADEANQGLLIPLLTIVAVMVCVGALACGVPARRALRIQPIEAMKDVG